MFIDLIKQEIKMMLIWYGLALVFLIGFLVYLFRHLKEASVLAYKWIALDDELPQICGYNVLGGLFQQGRVPDERGVHEFFDQVGVVLRSGSIPLKHAAMNAVYRFADIDKDCERVAENMMKSMDVEIF